MNWDSLTENEQEMYRELTKRIDGLRFAVYMLFGLLACIAWRLW